MAPALGLTAKLIDAGLRAPAEVTGRSLKAGLKWSNKIGAAVALILGPSEIEENSVLVRDLREGTQETVAQDAVVEKVRNLLGRR